MSRPLIDEIVNKIVDSFTDELRFEYYNTVIRQDSDFDVTAHISSGSPKEVTREIVFQYIYSQVWNSVHSKMTNKEVEKIFLT